jgi:co-chaperonin GroES (HSP10)
MLALEPLPGRVLVEIREKYSHVATTEQKYDTKTSGICIDWFAPMGHKDEESIAVLNTVYEHLPGKLVFWQEYREGAIIERDGKKYAFIKIEDLDGWEDVKGN